MGEETVYLTIREVAQMFGVTRQAVEAKLKTENITIERRNNRRVVALGVVKDLEFRAKSEDETPRTLGTIVSTEWARRVTEADGAGVIAELLEESVGLPLGIRVRALVAAAQLRNYAGMVTRVEIPPVALCDGCGMEEADMAVVADSIPGIPFLCHSCLRFTGYSERS